METLDAVMLRIEGTPKRVVSLVPSYTRSIFDLGFGDSVVGVTDYCTQPAGMPKMIARVGGPMDLHVDQIRALNPDLVLANQEENAREPVLQLLAAGLNVWVTFPKTVKDMFTVLSGMVHLYGNDAAAMRLRMLETSFDWAVLAAAELRRKRYFCPIWQDTGPAGELYWMTFHQDTYSADLLDQLGGENVFAQRCRRYPLAADLGLAPAEPSGDRDIRYPRVSQAEVLAVQPEIIFLPDEPYDFDATAGNHLRELLAETPAVRSGQVYPIDGRWITWCGTAIGDAIVELPRFLSGSNEEKL